MSEKQAAGPSEWARFNPLTHTYDTPDGTRVAAELVERATCLADVLHIATVRAKQRTAKATEGSTQ